jgi:aminopeptidase-like protein
VYILIADSGLCVLDRKYGEADMDPNLISGFLTALIQFGRELSDGNRVHVIDFGAFDICLSLKDNVIVAATVDKVDDGNAAMAVLGEVNSAFSQKYGSMLQEWDGNLEPFETFYTTLDEITKEGRASFDIAKKCDGKLTTRDIADQLGMHMKEVQKSLNKLEDMKILEWKEIG